MNSLINKKVFLSFFANDFESTKNIIKNYNNIELRLDYCSFNLYEFKQVFSYNKNIISTCRIGNYCEDKRLELLLQAINFGTNYIDLDINEDANIYDNLISNINKKKIKLILSYHNYYQIVTQDEMINIINSCINKNPSIIKIVCKSNSEQDNQYVLSIYDNPIYNEIKTKNIELITFCMGNIGTPTRIESLTKGNPFIYTSLADDYATANGQMTYYDVINILK